ncbi:MAG TPA: phage tail sheath subtilisin-like domain-containing protein [Rhizomicrobium sp.]|nr:phage tail sheath subtilisin-like domain-containing protein [Rhizomicrobium sp.]
MPSYLSPGVFVEEISSGPRPIQAVGTSTAGFVGVAPNPGAHLDEAVAINNWAQFVREYVRDGDASTDLSNAVYGFFLNGGSRCYVVAIKAGTPIAAKDKGLKLLEEIDEIAIIAAPGMTDAASYDALLTSAETMKDRFAILDGPESVDDVEALTRVADPGSGAASPPASGGGSAPAPKSKTAAGARPRNSDGGYGAYYFPELRVMDPLGDKIVSVPPSGHMAGIYARTDAKRGVQKTPANEIVYGALSLTYNVTTAEQDVLNPKGVNCIRFFSRDGVRVWGGRTLAPEGDDFVYIAQRRLFNMVEESIAQSTRWVVFEPNDTPLWKMIERDCRAFLSMLHRQGVFAGPIDKAFFVKCDAETNPPEVVDAGRVVTQIGLATLRPAEFVVFEIGQSQDGSTTLTAA